MWASPAPILKLGDRSSFEGVEGTIHGCDSVGNVHEVAHIPRLGVDASPHLGGVDIDQASELLISHRMAILDEPYQVAHQQGLVIRDLAVRHDELVLDVDANDAANNERMVGLHR